MVGTSESVRDTSDVCGVGAGAGWFTAVYHMAARRNVAAAAMQGNPMVV